MNDYGWLRPAAGCALLKAKVPPCPRGVGDRAKDKARERFRKSPAVNPNRIDPNFFYGEYLFGQDWGDEARRYMEKVLAAPPRRGRANWPIRAGTGKSGRGWQKRPWTHAN